MKTRLRWAWAIPGLGILLLVATAPGQQPPADPDAAAQGVDVQARGPVHEAFAAPTGTQPVQGAVVPKQPPQAIEELPPDQKPEGDNVQWIPGYWSWDDEASDFLWVSGCWRDVPPGRRWMPGHWQSVEGGFVWVAGFWATDTQTEVQYLPSPPPTLDQGPATPAPDANSIYIPGCWVYQTNRYLWRPGHWIAHQLGWLWTPACYIWTPSGYIFVDGYWDHPFDLRGLLFAPVRIDQRLFAAARRPFVPRFVVHNDFLLGALFVRSRASHYYFGDYFEPRYDKLGFVAWPDYHPVKGAFDPAFAYYSRLHAGDAKWEPALRNLYTGRRNGEIPRPPVTWAKQAEVVRAINANKTAEAMVHKNVNLTHVQNVSALAPLAEINKQRVTNLAAVGGGKSAAVARELKLEAVTKESHEREVKAAAVLRESAQIRRDAEARVLVSGKIPVQHTDPAHSIKLELPKPPAAIGVPRPPVRVAPPVVVVPKHEERPIPKFEPPHPIGPPPKKK